MATKSSSAQHFLECDNCEEHPAKFLCKTCPGHICEKCKTEHEKKKMTRSHEIVSLISNNEDMVDLLCCTKHTKKKLECYCNRCKEPVCTDCIIQSHNGHSVESLSTVYKRIADYAKQQKEKIDNLILPKYRELLSDEKAKQSALTKRAEEIKKKIEAHTQSLVEIIVTIGTQRVEDLSKKEKDGLREIEHTMSNIEEQIKKLQLMSKTISSDIEAKPQISFFKLVERYDLKSFERTISTTNYSLSDFQPGDTRTFKENFGIQPNLQRSGDRESFEVKLGAKLAVKPIRTRPDRTTYVDDPDYLQETKISPSMQQEALWKKYLDYPLGTKKRTTYSTIKALWERELERQREIEREEKTVIDDVLDDDM